MRCRRYIALTVFLTACDTSFTIRHPIATITCPDSQSPEGLAALQVLSRRGDNLSEQCSPTTINLAVKDLQCVKEWANTLTDACAKKNYLFWVDSLMVDATTRATKERCERKAADLGKSQEEMEEDEAAAALVKPPECATMPSGVVTPAPTELELVPGSFHERVYDEEHRPPGMWP